jgi:hypothetical protein
VSFQSLVAGVTHPINSLPDVRRTDARCAGIDRPDGVTLSFQVSAYSIEPCESVFARNLFAKDDERAADFDMVEGCGP